VETVEKTKDKLVSRIVLCKH